MSSPTTPAAVDVEYLLSRSAAEIEGHPLPGRWERVAPHPDSAGLHPPPDTLSIPPYGIDTSVGVDRTCHGSLFDAYAEE